MKLQTSNSTRREAVAKQRQRSGKLRTAPGFTLLELMAAMVLLTIAMSIAFEAFSGTIRGWKRGTEVVEGIKHGEFAMNQLAAALNSTIYFNNPRKSYAFEMEKGTVNSLPADTISFVTASGAFMPEGSPLQHGPHRLELFIDDDEVANENWMAAYLAMLDQHDCDGAFDGPFDVSFDTVNVSAPFSAISGQGRAG